MATLYIQELSAIGGGGNHPVSGAQQPPITEQIVNISGSSTQSATLHVNTTMLRINTDSTCSILFGANPTATTSNARLAANQTEYFTVPPNSGFVVAVIANS